MPAVSVNPVSMRSISVQTVAARIVGASGSTGTNAAFITTWETTSPSEQITIPLVSGVSYDFDIDWGDGNQETVTSAAISGKSHTYTNAGTHTVTITRIFPRIYFNNGGDKLKIKSIDNWGDVGFSSTQTGAFYGCTNISSLPSDHLEFFNSGLTNGTSMFRSTSLTSLPAGMTLDALSTGSTMFRDSSLTSLPAGMTLAALSISISMFYNNSLTSLPTGMTLAALSGGALMFYNNNLTSLPDGMTLAVLDNGNSIFSNNNLTSLPAGMTLAVLTIGNSMFLNNAIATSDYSGLLVRIEANNQNNSVTFHGGSSRYDATGAVARAALIADHLWTITDGGPKVTAPAFPDVFA